MRWLGTVLRELVALFVDDGSLAVLAVLWLAAVWLILPLLVPEPGLRGLLLFLGLAAILIGSARAGARRRRAG
jgi:hypothetical protein